VEHWGDLLEEFGFERGKFIVAIEKSMILRQLAEYIQSLHPPRFPVMDDLKRAKRKSFQLPSDNAIRRQIGEKAAVIRTLIEFCEGKDEYSQTLAVCEAADTVRREAPADSDPEVMRKIWAMCISFAPKVHTR